MDSIELIVVKNVELFHTYALVNWDGVEQTEL